MRRRKTGAFIWALLLLGTAIFFFFLMKPGAVLAVFRDFWKCITVLLGIFSIEVAMVYLRGVVRVSSRTALLIGCTWVNLAWIWWTALFTMTAFLGTLLYHSHSRAWPIRYFRFQLKRLIRFASERSRSRHPIVCFLRKLIKGAGGTRWRIAILFFLAGIVPHGDIAAIFVATTYGYPAATVISLRGAPILRFPYMIGWTILAMNAKVLFINLLFGI